MENEDKRSAFNHKDLKKPHYYGIMDGVHVFHGSHEGHKQHIGKHLENPSDEDLKAGIDEAKEKGLHHVYIHGAPPHSMRASVSPEAGPHIPGEINKSDKANTMKQEKLGKSDAAHPKLSDLHNAIRDHAKKHDISIPDHHFEPKKRSAKKEGETKEPSSKPPQASVHVNKSELISKVQQVLSKIEEEIITISSRELTKGLVYPDSQCDACGCKVEGCLCFEGFSEPSFNFDGKKVSILFKNDWDDASKESYLSDFKRRVGRLLKK
jgi:hypothetical protein